MIVALGDRPDVVAMVPTLGADDGRLAACLRSLESQDTTLRLAIICVANGGDPAPVLPPLTTLVTPGLNLGWAGSLTFARSIADAELLWMIQDDMEVHPGCLAALAEALATDDGLGCVAPAAVDRDGLIPPRSVGGVLEPGPVIRMREWLPAERVAPDQITGLDRLDYVASRGCLVRATAWDSVGGPDPRYYPVLWADVDFCTALRAAGWRFGLVTDALTHHEHNGSTPSPYGQFLFERNNERFARKWGVGRAVAAPQAAPDPAIPTTLMSDIAVAASGALRDLADAFSDLTDAHAAVRAELARAERDIDDLRGSHSWRATRPLRAIAELVRRRDRRSAPPR